MDQLYTPPRPAKTPSAERRHCRQRRYLEAWYLTSATDVRSFDIIPDQIDGHHQHRKRKVCDMLHSCLRPKQLQPRHFPPPPPSNKASNLGSSPSFSWNDSCSCFARWLAPYGLEQIAKRGSIKHGRTQISIPEKLPSCFSASYKKPTHGSKRDGCPMVVRQTVSCGASIREPLYFPQPRC